MAMEWSRNRKEAPIMFSRLLPISLLIFSLSSLDAHAKRICSSIAECQDMIKQAQTRIQNLSTPGGQRVSSTGAVFIRDVSVPALGEAYRDPSGLIWGSIVIDQGMVNKMNYVDAKKYCKDGGARLPTMEELEQLAKYLGKDTAGGYRPYLADGKTDFLPGLNKNWFWSSSAHPSLSDQTYAFNAEGGNIGVVLRAYYRLGVRCVAGR